jgi:hypothetical protein
MTNPQIHQRARIRKGKGCITKLDNYQPETGTPGSRNLRGGINEDRSEIQEAIDLNMSALITEFKALSILTQNYSCA